MCLYHINLFHGFCVYKNGGFGISYQFTGSKSKIMVHKEIYDVLIRKIEDMGVSEKWGYRDPSFNNNGKLEKA